MNALTIVTPSYRQDLELLRDQHQSILRHTPPDVRHVVVVPRRDRALFARLPSTRIDLLTVDEIVPRRFIGVPAANLWVNTYRPWPPVRGWVMQQVAKIAAILRAPTRTVLMLDSDILLVKDIDEQSFGDEDGVLAVPQKGWRSRRDAPSLSLACRGSTVARVASCSSSIAGLRRPHAGLG